MEVQLKVIGVCLIILGLIHAAFPRRFNWKQELSSLSIINKEMMYVHTFFIAFTLLLMGTLCLTSSSDLITTVLGKKISLGFAVFWFLRLIAQFFGYSKETWQGKPLETVIHVLFTIFWSYLAFIFFWVYIN
jgi:hypothetical protein